MNGSARSGLARGLAGLAGVLLLGAAAAQGLAGWPALAAPLLAAGVPPERLLPLAAGWYFGTACIVGFAALAFASAFSRDGSLPVRRVLGTVAAVWILFGATAMVLRDGNTHYLNFIGLGVFVAIAAWAARRP
jgi:hypothetical protein